jgi:hypothetical protein
MEKVKKHLWRKDEFVCSSDYYQELQARTKGLSPFEADIQNFKVRACAEETIRITRAAIKKMMRV